jgi:signal transduction histidine kinase
MESKDFKILLIEDEPDVRESYIDMLEVLGYEADCAENGKAGLEKLRQKDYQIILTDLNMPVMDGLEMLKRAKKMKPDTEVIVITGFATIENAISAMKQGAFDYVTKPVSLEHVKIVLNRCVQQISSSRENQMLRDTNAHLSELNELKNKFITITNHELRTPLAVLKGYFDLVEMYMDESTDEELGEYIKIISNTLDEMIDMVESMHDLSGFYKAMKNYENRQVNVNEVARNIYRELKLLFEAREIQFTVELHKEPAPVLADAVLLKRALRELAQNALKFTDKGGKVNLRVKAIPMEKRVYVMVQDTGIGIPTDKMELIFEPFYEVQDVMHHTTSKTEFMGGGIGVGLALTKEILATCSGDIAVESQEGRGSIFTIMLPLHLNGKEH